MPQSYFVCWLFVAFDVHVGRMHSLYVLESTLHGTTLIAVDRS